MLMQHRSLRLTVVLGLLVVRVPSFLNAAPPIAYRGAKILTAAGKTFDLGTLLVQDGRILAVGSDADISPLIGPATEVHRLAGADFPHIAR